MLDAIINIEGMKVKFVVLFFLISNISLPAQESNNIHDAILVDLLERKEYKLFFKKINEFALLASELSNIEQIKSLSNYLKLEYANLDSAEKLQLRKTSTYLGNMVWNHTGNINQSLELFLIAHENVENKQTLDSLAWFIENKISNLYTRKGDFEMAEYYANLLEGSLKHFGMTEYLSRYYTNKGRKLKSEYKIEEAIAIYAKGLILADSIQYLSGMFANALNLAELYNENPALGSAEVYLKQATEVLELLKSDSKYLEKRAVLEIEKGNFKTLLGNYSEGIIHYKEGIKLSKEFYETVYRREFATYYAYLAQAYLRMDSLASAMISIQKGFFSLIPELTNKNEGPSIHQLYPENKFISLFDLSAQVKIRQFRLTQDRQNLEDALHAIELGMYVNDLIRENVIADPSKLISVRGNKDLIERGILILSALYSIEPNENCLTTVRSFFNRSKSLLFSEKSRRNGIAEIMSGADKEEWAKIQKKLMDLYNYKLDHPIDSNRINGEILTCHEQINHIFSKYDNIQFRETIPVNYIEYVMTGENIFVLSNIDENKKFIELGSQSEFQNLSNRLNEFILLKGYSLDDSILNDMYKFLIKPIVDSMPGKIVIIPDGAIGYVPFEMLKDETGSYLLEKSTISYSFEYITEEYQNDIKIKKWEIFCLAPEYEINTEVMPDSVRGSLGPLPYAKKEVENISQLYEGYALISQSAIKEEWLTNMTDSRIFHYAGHAIIRGEKAHLALTANDFEKEQLSGEEIGLLHNSWDLVVLSACETGLGKMEEGEGIRSLGRNFMESGARATIISLWNVNDKSTATIMSDFYRHLREGIDKDEALRLSKLNYIKNTSNKSNHPFYWAAFIPAGDMRPLKNN